MIFTKDEIKTEERCNVNRREPRSQQQRKDGNRSSSHIRLKLAPHFHEREPKEVLTLPEFRISRSVVPPRQADAPDTVVGTRLRQHRRRCLSKLLP